MESVKVFLTCPNCGNSTWVQKGEADDYMFECLACEDLYHPEDMGSSTEVITYNSDLHN